MMTLEEEDYYPQKEIMGRNDFEDSRNDEEDTRSTQEYLNDLEEVFQGRSLLAKSKRFFKNGSQRYSGAKETNATQCHKCGRKGYFVKNKGLVVEAYKWDEEYVSSDDNEMTKVKVLMHPLPPLKKLVGAEPVSRPKTIKSIFKLNSIFKAKTLKGVTINELSLAHAKCSKNISSSKNNSAPTSKLKNVKIKDDLSLSCNERTK
nr:retrovirus-related Pol polyprotein from transposon TNT 1-94 [Tanacetum cinerariifolium]